MSEWQPIETAPTDTRVLIYAENSVIEGWKNERNDWDIVTLECHGCGCCAFGNPKPTHWMPLPQPPKNEETK